MVRRPGVVVIQRGYPIAAREVVPNVHPGCSGHHPAVAITTMEYEPGGIRDLQALLDRLIPVQGDYEHNRLNHDTNSHAHQRASIIGPSEAVPVQGGRLALGTWQQLVVVDFDDHPRERTVLVQVTS